MEDNNDIWAAASAVYAQKSVEITRPFARLAVSLAQNILPIDGPDILALDNGCGSGAVTSALLAHNADTKVVATDSSPAMLQKFSEQDFCNTTNNKNNINVLEIDAMNLTPLLSRYPTLFTHVFSLFMTQFTSNPLHSFREMIRACRPGGVVAVGSWGRFDLEDVFVAAARMVDSEWTSPGLWPTKVWPEDREGLVALFEAQGLGDVRVERKVEQMGFGGVEEFVGYVFGSGNPALERLINAFGSEFGEDGVEKLRSFIPDVLDSNGWEVKELKAIGFVTVGKKRKDC